MYQATCQTWARSDSSKNLVWDELSFCSEITVLIKINKIAPIPISIAKSQNAIGV